MSEQLTQEQIEQADKLRAEWVRNQFQKANEHLASQGIIIDNVSVNDSRYLPPYLAIWKLNTKDNQSFWVISGDLPTDYIPLSVASDAREAVRNFSLQWQMKAEKLIHAGITEQTQADYVKLLVNRAHNLYEMFSKDELWQPVSNV